MKQIRPISPRAKSTDDNKQLYLQLSFWKWTQTAILWSNGQVYHCSQPCFPLSQRLIHSTRKQGLANLYGTWRKALSPQHNRQVTRYRDTKGGTAIKTLSLYTEIASFCPSHRRTSKLNTNYPLTSTKHWEQRRKTGGWLDGYPCLVSLSHPSGPGQICQQHVTCCHTEKEAVHQTCNLAKSQYTETTLTSPCVEPIMPARVATKMPTRAVFEA